MLSDPRDVARQASVLSPVELCAELARISDAVLAAVQSRGGIVHQYVGGSVVACWTSSPQQAFEAALAALSDAGPSIGVAVAFGDVAEVAVGTSGRTVLVGTAYSRAEQVLRKVPTGAIGTDLATLPLLPPGLRERFTVSPELATLAKPPNQSPEPTSFTAS